VSPTVIECEEKIKIDPVKLDNDVITMLNRCLIDATRQGKSETTIKDYLKQGADINCKDDYDWSPLMNAARCGHMLLVKLYLRQGADINARDRYDWAAIHWAVAKGHHDVYRVLLENGADVKLGNKGTGALNVMMKSLSNVNIFTEMLDFLNAEEREQTRLLEEKKKRKQLKNGKKIAIGNRILSLLQDNKLPTLEIMYNMRHNEHGLVTREYNTSLEISNSDTNNK